jgi:hypothetical protein
MIRGWLKESIETAQHARETIEIITAERNLPPDTLIDTVIIGWDCHQNWDRSQAKKWLKDIKLGGHPSPSLTTLISTKDYLDRLQSVAIFRNSLAVLEFLYIGEKFKWWSPVAAPELLHSDTWLVRYKKKEQDGWTNGAVYFDTEEPSKIRFLARYLNYSGLDVLTSLTVHVQCPQNELERFENYFNNEISSVVPHLSSTSEFKFVQLPKATFQS